eukprot:1358967-Rhodomonas_salina.1
MGDGGCVREGECDVRCGGCVFEDEREDVRKRIEERNTRERNMRESECVCVGGIPSDSRAR